MGGRGRGLAHQVAKSASWLGRTLWLSTLAPERPSYLSEIKATHPPDRISLQLNVVSIRSTMLENVDGALEAFRSIVGFA